MSENKLQIRARVLSAIINLQNNNSDLSFVGNTLDDLNTIQDKTALLDILYKEFLKENTEGHNQLAKVLLEREVIYSEDVEQIFGKRAWISRSEEILELQEKANSQDVSTTTDKATENE